MWSNHHMAPHASDKDMLSHYQEQQYKNKPKFLSAVIEDVEKRYAPSKYYIYKILVSREGKAEYVIFRRYSQFDDLESNLKKKFPIEGGKHKSSDRILPQLPSKKLLSRSAVADVAEERRPQLQEYLNALLKCPPKLSRSDIVAEFLKHTSEDTEQEELSGTTKSLTTRPPPTEKVAKPQREAAPRSTGSKGTSLYASSASASAAAAAQPPPSNEPAKIVVHYNGAVSEIVVGTVQVLQSCTYEQLISNVQQHLGNYLVAVNYLAEDGSLVPIQDQAEFDVFRDAFDVVANNRLDVDVTDRY